MQAWLIIQKSVYVILHFNSLKKKNQKIMISWYIKLFYKIHHTFMIFYKIRKKKQNFLNLIKSIYKKT